VEQDILYSFFWSNIYIVRTPSLTLSYFISLLYIYIYWLILSHQSNYKLECDRWSIDYYYYYFFLFGPITKMHHKRNTGPTYNTGRYYILPLSFFFFLGQLVGLIIIASKTSDILTSCLSCLFVAGMLLHANKVDLIL